MAHLNPLLNLDDAREYENLVHAIEQHGVLTREQLNIVGRIIGYFYTNYPDARIEDDESLKQFINENKLLVKAFDEEFNGILNDFFEQPQEQTWSVDKFLQLWRLGFRTDSDNAFMMLELIIFYIQDDDEHFQQKLEALEKFMRYYSIDRSDVEFHLQGRYMTDNEPIENLEKLVKVFKYIIEFEETGKFVDDYYNFWEDFASLAGPIDGFYVRDRPLNGARRHQRNEEGKCCVCINLLFEKPEFYQFIDQAPLQLIIDFIKRLGLNDFFILFNYNPRLVMASRPDIFNDATTIDRVMRKLNDLGRYFVRDAEMKDIKASHW